MKNLIKKIIPLLLVIVMIMGMSVLGVSASGSFYAPGIDSNGIYYIMSADTGRYLDMPSTVTTGDLITTSFMPSSGYTYSKQWYATPSGTNQVSFIGAVNPYGYGMSTYYLSVSAYPYPQDVSFGRFTLERVTYPSTSSYYEFSGTYTIKQGTDYVASNSNGSVYLTSTLGADCFWSFMNIDKGNANLFSFNYPDGSNNGRYNSTANNDYFEEIMSDMGYDATYYINSSAVEAHTLLNSSDIFVFRGHGTTGTLIFFNSSGYNVGNIFADVQYAETYEDVTGITSRAVGSFSNNGLKNVRCVLYLGCSTGLSIGNLDEYNLVNVTYECGAQFVMGTTETVKTSVNNEWLYVFISEIANGKNIQTAITEANLAAKIKYVNVFGDNSSTDGSGTSSGGQDYIYPIYYVGDTTQYLNIP
ncbi:MAG: hypothetical protein IJZ03_02595 [Clostridia bacterium]|nr:hypothetical protein [Clostridia bacterium]